MNPITHLLTGWLVSNIDHLERRDRSLVTAAAVIPDIDALGIISDWVSKGQSELSLFQQFHHILAHNVFFCLLLILAGYALSKKKRLSALLILISFHSHIISDLLSGRGLDGSVWPIAYFYPVYAESWYWPGQWELNAWPNFLITVVLLAASIYLAWKRGFSPVSIFSMEADRFFVSALRNRCPGRFKL